MTAGIVFRSLSLLRDLFYCAHSGFWAPLLITFHTCPEDPTETPEQKRVRSVLLGVRFSLEENRTSRPLFRSMGLQESSVFGTIASGGK